MNAYRFSAFLLILVAPFTSAMSQTDEGREAGEQIGASAFADAEEAYAAGNYRRAIGAYRVAMEDYGQENDEHASYIYYRTAAALLRLGFAIPYGTEDEFGKTEDYALLAKEAVDKAIWLAGITPTGLSEGDQAVTAGGAEPYGAYDLSESWQLDQNPAGTQAEMDSLHDPLVQMFVIRAVTRNILWNFEGAVDDALVAWRYRDYLNREVQLDVLNTLGDSYVMRGRKEDACLWFQEGVRLTQGAPGGYGTDAMAEGAEDACNASDADSTMAAPAEAPGDQPPFDDAPAATERLQFGQGATSATVPGLIRPDQTVRYLVGLQQGQRVRFRVRVLRGTENINVDVYAPGLPLIAQNRLPDDAPDLPAVYEGQPASSGDYQFVVSNGGGWAIFDVEVETY